MRIAQLAPLAESIPPKLYGGTERVIAWLVDELVELGHEVTLFASGDSKTKAKLQPVWPRAPRLGRRGGSERRMRAADRSHHRAGGRLRRDPLPRRTPISRAARSRRTRRIRGGVSQISPRSRNGFGVSSLSCRSGGSHENHSFRKQWRTMRTSRLPAPSRPLAAAAPDLPPARL